MQGGANFQTLSCGIITPPTSSKWEKRAFGRIIANGQKRRDTAIANVWQRISLPQLKTVSLVLPNAPSTQIVITEAIRVLHIVEASRDTILAQMQALAKTLPEYSLVREMPCIGDTLAPRLIAEIGDVRRFHSKRALIAYAGIDAPPYQSGKFCANNRHISKRGNRYLRKTGYEVMQSYVMHKPANDPIFTFIEKKRSEGKCGKLAMVAGLNKFLRIYYGKVIELYRSLPATE